MVAALACGTGIVWTGAPAGDAAAVLGAATRHAPTPPAPAAPAPERFIGYWTAYGTDVSQLQPGETYGWGPSWDDTPAAVGSPRPDYLGIDLAVSSSQLAEQVHDEGATYAYKPLLVDRSIVPGASWFASYLRTVLLPVVTGSAYSEPDLIVLETELDGAIGPAFDAEWRQVIAALRTAGYHGKLLATSDGRYIAGWWDAVDYVGGDTYPAIDTSSVAAATRSWQRQLGWQVAAYQRATGKPVIWGELGSYQGSLDAVQWRNYLRGFFLAMGADPGWSGALFWSGWEGFATEPEPQTLTAPPVPGSRALAQAAALLVP